MQRICHILPEILSQKIFRKVLDAMLPYLTSYYGNPHSRTHAYGWESEKAMETARQQVRFSLWFTVDIERFI